VGTIHCTVGMLAEARFFFQPPNPVHHQQRLARASRPARCIAERGGRRQLTVQ
jgi:hypothetical protein